MSEKIVSQLDDAGYFLHATVADESPLEPGVYLLPFGAVDLAPPVVPAGQRAKYSGGKFVMENIPQPEPEPEPAPPTDAEIAEAVSAARQRAYQHEADPVFFKAQRGEATKEEWLAKVEEIKARIPDGVMPS